MIFLLSFVVVCDVINICFVVRILVSIICDQNTHSLSNAIHWRIQSYLSQEFGGRNQLTAKLAAKTTVFWSIIISFQSVFQIIWNHRKIVGMSLMRKNSSLFDFAFNSIVFLEFCFALYLFTYSLSDSLESKGWHQKWNFDSQHN